MMLLGDNPLASFLNQAAELDFAWGQFDCLLWLADWTVRVRGVDPATGWRGSYSTLRGAARVVIKAGGMVSHVDSCMSAVGINRSETPQRGDVGLFSVVGPSVGAFENLAGGILLDGTVALLMEDGLLFPKLSDVPPIAVWRIVGE